MSKSLLDALPGIVAAGKRQANQILEQLESSHRVTLQTRELVIPSKDVSQGDLERLARSGTVGVGANRLIYGDNLLAMAALLAGDEGTPSLRGAIDLIYIDPPFDSKADYDTAMLSPEWQTVADDQFMPSVSGLMIDVFTVEREWTPADA